MVHLSPRTRSIVTAVGFLTGAYDMFVLNIGEPAPPQVLEARRNGVSPLPDMNCT